MRVLLMTTAVLNQNLGGPGKFVPMLMEAVESLGMDYIKVNALCYRQFYKSADEFSREENIAIKYSQPSDPIGRFKHVIKRIMYPLYFPGRVAMNIRRIPLYRTAVEILRKNEWDVIHAHDFEAALIAEPFARAFKKPLILTNHYKGSLYREAIYPSFPYFRTPLWRRYFQKREMKAITVVDVLTFPSESARDLLVHDYPELKDVILNKSDVIYTGIPDPTIVLQTGLASIEDDGDPNLGLTVVNVANHIPDKGIDIALFIFRDLIRLTSIDLRFVNYGMPGPETYRLRKLAHELGIAEKVSFKGVLPHSKLLRVLHKAFVILHTPRKVVFDLVLLEAMALGTPVIATAVKGNKEALGETYPLLIPLDNPTIDHNQIKLLEQGKNLIGAILRSRYEEKFKMEVMAKSYLALWLSVIERGLTK